MKRYFICVVVVVLSGCASTASQTRVPTPCDAAEATYACQVERYNNVSG